MVAAIVGVATLAAAAPAVAASATPTFAPPPDDATFPIPAPAAISFSDSWHACRDGCTRRHQGNDLLAEQGAPVVAVEAGVVARVHDADTGKAGLSLWLRGDSGNAYFYAHNSAILVTEGQRVARGQLVALVGNTGNAAGGPPHVHFQINRCGELTSSEPCTVSPYEFLRTWPQEQIDGGADALGWYVPADSTFALHADGGSPYPPVAFGVPGDLPLTGDWDGDGRDAFAVYRRSDATFYFRDDASNVLPVPFGVPGEDVVPLSGDWDGDGRDSVALYRASDATLHFRDDSGNALPPVTFGEPGAGFVPLSGDWDGDRRDSLALFRPADAVFLLFDDGTDALPATANPLPAQLGLPGDLPLVGDWDGDGRDGIAVYRPSEATLSVDGLPVPLPVAAPAGAVPLAGDWNGRDVVTFADVQAIFGGAVDPLVLLANLPVLNVAMVRSGAVTPARKAAFLATVFNESGLRADSVQGGKAPYRGRGFVQLTGAGNYRNAGAALGLDLLREPDLAANPLASAAIASWYWTVARNINVAADHLDMAAVNIAVGYARNPAEDDERCAAFVTALAWFSGGTLPFGINCERNAAAAALARVSSPRAGAPARAPSAPAPAPTPASAPPAPGSPPAAVAPTPVPVAPAPPAPPAAAPQPATTEAPATTSTAATTTATTSTTTTTTTKTRPPTTTTTAVNPTQEPVPPTGR